MFSSLNSGGVSGAVVTARCLEAYALDPDSRQDVVKSCNPATREYSLLRLRLLSQEMQDPAAVITLSNIVQVNDLLNQARSRLTPQEYDQLRYQLAVLAYPINPALLLTQIGFNAASVTQLDTKALEIVNEVSTWGKAQPKSLCDSLPTTLNEELIRTETIAVRIIEQLKTAFHAVDVPASAWPHLLTHPKMETLLLDKMRTLYLMTLFRYMDVPYSPRSLEIIEQADGAKIDELMVKIILRLYREKELRFTDDMRQLRYLTCDQLMMLRNQEPSLMYDDGFIGQLEKRIVPREFVSWEEKRQGVVYREWLDRMMEFVNSLPPKYNRHRMAVYLMSLEYDLTKGTMDKAKFIRQVFLPSCLVHLQTTSYGHLSHIPI
jgi:hypothetical protein